MKKVTLTIKAQGVQIADHVSIYEAETLAKAVGLAIMGAHQNLTSQYVDPAIYVDDIQLTKGMVSSIKGNYWTFQETFAKIRESILPIYAIIDSKEREEYVRRVDVNGYFKSQKSFTTEQLASIAKEQLKKTQFALTINRQQAKSAVWSADEQKLLDAHNAIKTAKRLAAAEAKKLAAK